MQHLPAYVAASRFVKGRRVLVVRPLSAAGPRLLLAAGAREVVACGGDVDPEPGLERVEGSWVDLPVRDQSVDLVLAIEALPTLRREERHALLREARRVLRGDGLFVGWIVHHAVSRSGTRERGTSAGVIDFWTLEDELRRTFGNVAMLAQLPWSGVSLAPITDDEGPHKRPSEESNEELDEDLHERGLPEPGLRLAEDLLRGEPLASHYVAFAGRVALPSALLRECLLVPQGSEDRRATRELARVEALSDEVERLREELGARAARAAALQRRVADLEAQRLEIERLQRDEQEVDLAALRDALQAAEAELAASQKREEELQAALQRKDRAQARPAPANDVTPDTGAEVASASHRLALEAKIRAEEQARMLVELEASSQRIWEMTELADRNAARFAASRAQIEVLEAKLLRSNAELERLRAGLPVTSLATTTDQHHPFAKLGEPGALLGGKRQTPPEDGRPADAARSSLSAVPGASPSAKRAEQSPGRSPSSVASDGESRPSPTPSPTPPATLPATLPPNASDPTVAPSSPSVSAARAPSAEAPSAEAPSAEAPSAESRSPETPLPETPLPETPST